MLPVLDLDYEALCGCQGDFFQPESRLLGVSAYCYQHGGLPPMGKWPEFLVSFICDHLNDSLPEMPLLFFYAPGGISQFALAVGQPNPTDLDEASWLRLETSPCPWLEKWPRCEKSGYFRLFPQAEPFLLWQKPTLTWLHRLEGDQSPKQRWVEDWGNPMGVVNEATTLKMWKSMQSQHEQYYVPVPAQKMDKARGNIVLNHAFYRAPVEPWE